jgi:hypothetical protein
MMQLRLWFILIIILMSISVGRGIHAESCEPGEILRVLPLTGEINFGGELASLTGSVNVTIELISKVSSKVDVVYRSIVQALYFDDGIASYDHQINVLCDGEDGEDGVENPLYANELSQNLDAKVMISVIHNESGVSKNLKLYDTPYVIDALTAKTARSGDLSKLGLINQDAPISNMFVATLADLQINGPRARVSVGGGNPQSRDDVVLDLGGITMNASAYYMGGSEEVSANSQNVSFVWQSNNMGLFYNNGRLSQSANNQMPYLVNFISINARNFYLNGSVLGVSDLWEHSVSENMLFTASIAGTSRLVENVGINVTYPKARLDVERAIRISNSLNRSKLGTILFDGLNFVGVVSKNNRVVSTENLNVNYLPNNFVIPNDDSLYFVKKNGSLIDKFEAPFFLFHDSDQLLLIEDRNGLADSVPRLNVLDSDDQLAFEVGHDGRIRSSGSSETNVPNLVANVGELNVSGLFVNGINQECRTLGTLWSSSISHDLSSGCLDPDYESVMNIYFDSPQKKDGSVAISYRGTEGNYPSNAGLELAYSGDVTLPESYYQTGLSFTAKSSATTPSVSYTMGVNIQYPHKFFVVQGTDIGQSRDGVFTPLFTMTSTRKYGLRMVTPNASFHIKSVTEDIGFLMNGSAGQDEVTQPAISIENETGSQATYLIFDSGMASLRAGLVDSNQWAASNFYQKNTAAMGRNSWVNGANSTILGGENNTIRLIPQSEFSAYRTRYGLSESSSKPFAENGFSVGDGNTIYSENSIALGSGVTINYDSTFMFSGGSAQDTPFSPTQPGQFLIDANLVQIMPKSTNNQSDVHGRFFSVHPSSIDSNWIQSELDISSANAASVFEELTNKRLILNNKLNVTVFDVNTIYQSKDGLRIVFEKQDIRSCVEGENLDGCLDGLILDSNVGVDNDQWLENVRPIVALQVLDASDKTVSISIPEFAATVNLRGTATPSVIVAQIVSPDENVLFTDFETRKSLFKADVKAQMIDSLIKKGILNHNSNLTRTSELYYPFDEDHFDFPSDVDIDVDINIEGLINRLTEQFEAPLVQFRGVNDDDGSAVSVFRNQLNLGGVYSPNSQLQVSHRMAVAGAFHQYRDVTSSMVALIGKKSQQLITITNNRQSAFQICSTGELRVGDSDGSECSSEVSTGPSHNIVVSGDFVVDGELEFGDGLKFDFNSKGYFIEKGIDTYYTSGNVGIGVTTPNTLLSLPIWENNQSNALSFYSDGMQLDIEARQSGFRFTTNLSNLNDPPIINIQENRVGLLTHTPNSGAQLHVSGNVAVTTLNFGVSINSDHPTQSIFLVTTGNVSRLNINGQFVGFQTTVWTKQDQYTYISDNNVSIGKDSNTPSFVFEVSGNAKFDMLNTRALSGSELNVETVKFNGSDDLTTSEDNLLINGEKLLSGVYESTSGATGNSVQFVDQNQSVLSKEMAIYWEDPQNANQNYFSHQDGDLIINNQYRLNSSANLTIDVTKFLIEKDVQSNNMSYLTRFLIDPNRDRSSGIQDQVVSLQTDVSEFPGSFSAQRINLKFMNVNSDAKSTAPHNYYGLGIEMTGPNSQDTDANVTGLSIDVSEMQDFPAAVQEKGGVFSAIFKGNVGIGKIPKSNFPKNFIKPIIDIAGSMKVEPFENSNVTLNLKLFASSEVSVRRSFLVKEHQVVVGRAIGEGGFNPGDQFSFAVEGNMAAHHVIATGNRGVTVPKIVLNKENGDAFFILQNTYPVFQFNHDGIPNDNEFFVGYRFPYSIQSAYHVNQPYPPVKKRVKHIDIEVVTSNLDTRMVGKQVEIRLRTNDRIQGTENQPAQLSGVQLNIDNRFTLEQGGEIIGVNVDVPTGDAAVFMGGAVGIGTADPISQLDVNGVMAFRTSSNLILNNDPYQYENMPSLETILVTQQLDAGQLGKITQPVSRITVNTELIVSTLNINSVMGNYLISSENIDDLDIFNLESNRIALQRVSVRSGEFNDGVTANVVRLNVVNNSGSGIQVLSGRAQKLSVTKSLKSNQLDNVFHVVFNKPGVEYFQEFDLYVTQNAVHFASDLASPNLMNTSKFEDLTKNMLIAYSKYGPNGTPLSISSDKGQPLFRYEQDNPQFILKATIPYQNTRESTTFQDYTLYDIDLRYSGPASDSADKIYYGALLTVTSNQEEEFETETVTGVSINVAAVSGTKYAALFRGGKVGIGNPHDIISQFSLQALPDNADALLLTIANNMGDETMVVKKMVVKKSGEVGIGADSPNHALHINGGMKLMTDSNTTVMHIDDENIQIGSESNDNTRLFISDDINVNDAFFVNTEEGNLGIGRFPFGNTFVVSGNARFDDLTMSEFNLVNNILVEGAGRVEMEINTAEQLNGNLELVSVKLNNYGNNSDEQSIYGTKIDVQITNNITNVNGIKVDVTDLQIYPSTTGSPAHDSIKYAAAFMGEYRFNGGETPFVRVGVGTDTPSKMLDISGNQQLDITPEISTMSMMLVGQRQLDSNFGFGIAVGVTSNTDFATFVVVSENQTQITHNMSLLLVSPNKVAFGYGHDLKSAFDDVNSQFLVYGGLDMLSGNSIRFNYPESILLGELIYQNDSPENQKRSAGIWLSKESSFQIQFKDSNSALVTPITFKSNVDEFTNFTQSVRIGDYDGNAKLSVGYTQAKTPTISVFEGQKNQTVLQLHSNARPINNGSFIDFKKNSYQIGLIGELNDENGISYVSKGADYAEYLEKKEPSETFLPGDVVGVFGGKISKDITNANFVMVISEMPIVVANYPGDENQSRFELVGFLGQVKVNVEGPVLPGDFLVPSGRHDGVAIALKLDSLAANQVPLLIGRALESYSEKGVGKVKTLVGFYTQADILSLYSSYLNQRVETLGQQNTALKSEFDRYETKRRAQIQKLQKIATQQDVKS